MSTLDALGLAVTFALCLGTPVMLGVLRIRREAPIPPAPAAPQHRADPLAQLEERRRQLRLEDQARFNAQGLPRFAVPPTEG